jgi:hypothetical protein
MSILVSLKQIVEALNFPEEEVMELVRQKRIPYLYFPKKDEYAFPKEEVLNQIMPRPKAKEESPFGPELTDKKEIGEPVVARRGRPKKQ